MRLKGYDYSRAGAYFVTIVTQDRSCLFGEVEANAVRLNDAGRMVQSVWDELSAFYPGVLVDEFVVMPNHVHGIIFLTLGQEWGPGQAGGPAAPELAGDADGRVGAAPRSLSQKVIE